MDTVVPTGRSNRSAWAAGTPRRRNGTHRRPLGRRRRAGLTASRPGDGLEYSLPSDRPREAIASRTSSYLGPVGDGAGIA
jgi:hypothetical protein